MRIRFKGQYSLDDCRSAYAQSARPPESEGERERSHFSLNLYVSALPGLCGGFLAFPNAAFAAAQTQAAAPVGAGSVFQMLLGLLVVLGLVFAAAWAMRRFSPHAIGGSNTVRILAGTSVGQRERVLLLEVNETWLLVGVAPGCVNALHTMAKPANAGLAPPTPAAAAGFATWLKQTMERRNG